MKKLKTKKGVAALMTMIIIVGIFMVIGLIAARLGINELIYGADVDRSNELAQIADSCAEEAYYRIKLDSTYSGGTLTFTKGSCIITISGGGSTRTVDIESSVGDLTRNFSHDISLESNIGGNSDGIDLTDWEEN